MGGLSLTAVNIERVVENPDIWEKAVRKLRARYMPPAGRPRPDEATYDALVSYLETSLDKLAASRPGPGRTDAFHRLNRTEYKNVIGDLLAIDVDVSSLLPKDDSSHGFDNVSVGGVSPALLERYVSAARKISRLAIGTPVNSPTAEVFVLPVDLTQEEHVEGLPFGTRGGTLVGHNFPRDGEYEIQLRLTRDRNENIEGLYEPHQMEVTLDGAQLQEFVLTPEKRGTGPNPDQLVSFQDKADANLRLRIAVSAGPHKVGAAFIKKPSALLDTELKPSPARFNMDRHPRFQPALYSVSIAGPFDETGVKDTTPSRKRIFVCRPAQASEEDACARTILSTLIRRAYRRPVASDDLQKAFTFYKDARAKTGFDGGIEMALRSILVNPEFLFRVEVQPPAVTPNTAYRISDLELASRLSFFLWSSIPDDELLDAAFRGRLHLPDNTTPVMAAAGVGTHSAGEDAGTEGEALEATNWRSNSAAMSTRSIGTAIPRCMEPRTRTCHLSCGSSLRRVPGSRSGIRRTHEDTRH